MLTKFISTGGYSPEVSAFVTLINPLTVDRGRFDPVISRVSITHCIARTIQRVRTISISMYFSRDENIFILRLHDRNFLRYGGEYLHSSRGAQAFGRK